MMVIDFVEENKKAYMEFSFHHIFRSIHICIVSFLLNLSFFSASHNLEEGVILPVTLMRDKYTKEGEIFANPSFSASTFN